MSEKELLVCSDAVHFISIPEPTIKVSELREWCEDRILSLELEENLCHYDFGVIFAYKDILNKFCGGKDD